MLKNHAFKITFCLIVLIFCIGTMGASVKAANLTHFPMLGAVTDTTLNIWIRSDAAASAVVQYQPTGGNWSQPLQSAAVNLVAGNDFTGTISLTNLSAGSSYDYRVILDGVVQAASTSVFKTFSSTGNGAQFTFVFGADIQQDSRPHTVFSKIAAQQPDFALLLGDNIYSDLPTPAQTEADFWNVYKLNRDSFFQSFANHTPIFTIWDDHDYGTDNSDSSYPLKKLSRAALGKYWANPPYVEQNASIYYKFSVADTDFFMLDSRWNRVPGVTMLGAAQLQWLKNQLLASTAKFKFIVSPVMVSDFGTSGADSWSGFVAERANIFQFIAQNNIKNVIILSGDQHWAGAFLINYPVFQIGHGVQGFYEIEPTPLSARTLGAPRQNDPQVLFEAGNNQYYGLARVDTTVVPRQVQFEIHRGSDAAIVYSLVVEEFTPTQAPTIVTSFVQQGTLNNPYSQTLTAAGGVTPYQWRLSNGSLPAGLNLSPNGTISGTPTQTGTFFFTATVQDAALATSSRTLSLTISSNPPGPPISTPGLVGYWSFDDGTATDNSGNGNNGTLINNPAVVAGKFGQALTFDGASQYVNVRDVLDPGSGDLSIFAWVKTTQAGGVNMIISKRNSSVITNAGYQLFQNSGGAVSFTFGDGKASRVRVDSTGPRINDGSWHLVGVVFTRAANGVIYVDGVPAIGGSGSIASQSGFVDNSLPLRFGLEDQTNQGFYWKGTIDEVRIYNRALSAHEVADMSNAVTPSPLIIVSTVLPAGTSNILYNQSLAASGGTLPYTWSLASGTLPPGLSLSQSGTISGTPTAAGTSTFTVEVKDNTLAAITQSFSLTINPAPNNPMISLSYDSQLQDRVGQAERALVPDGKVDGVFTVTLNRGSGNRTVTRLQLTNTPGGIWNTQPGDGFWSLGVANGLVTPLLNAADDSVNFPLVEGSSFKIFAADYQSLLFVNGTTFTLTVNFADGSMATSSTTVTGSFGSVILTYNDRLRDRVGQSNQSQGVDGHFDPTFTVTFPTGGSTRTVTSLRLDGTNNGGTWDTNSATVFWTLGAASALDAPLYNDANDAVNFPVSPGGSFNIFASDWFFGQRFPNGLFQPGNGFTLIIGFSDGTAATATASVPQPIFSAAGL